MPYIPATKPKEVAKIPTSADRTRNLDAVYARLCDKDIRDILRYRIGTVHMS